MAIIIPSKNIYEINNPKIRDNLIDNVSVEQNVVAPNNEYEVSVYNKDYQNNLDFINSTPLIDNQIDWYATTIGFRDSYTEAISCVGITPIYFEQLLDSIKVVQKNKYISKIYDKLDEEGKANIKYSFFCEKQYGTLTATATLTDNYMPNDKTIVLSNFNYSEPTIDKNSFSEFPLEISNTEKTYYGQIVVEVEAKKTITNINNLGEIEYTVVNEDFVANKNAKILCGYSSYKLGNTLSAWGDELTTTRQLSGTYENYIPKSISITLYGNTIGIDLTDGSVSYIKDENGNIVQGKGNKPHSLSGNELLQDSAKVGNIPLTEHLANNVLSQYAKGKETATLLCDIADYYDYNSGDKVIDTKTNKMSFRLHDQVIPYIFGANGQDQPMSKYSNGTPKVFQIVGSKIFYDGAVWQEITLQEI